MDSKDKIAARIIILPEVFNEKTKNNVDLKEFYGEWYKFDGKELDVSVYSESFIDKEKTQKETTYFFRMPDKSIRLIPKRHCKVVYEFL